MDEVLPLCTIQNSRGVGCCMVDTQSVVLSHQHAEASVWLGLDNKNTSLKVELKEIMDCGLGLILKTPSRHRYVKNTL